MEPKFVEFELFRYQLLPATQHAQEDFFHKIYDSEDIRVNKNKFFFEAISNLPTLYHRTVKLNHKMVLNSDPWIAFKLATYKTLERDNVEFRKERIENWPHVTVLINNSPDVQVIAVSKNRKAFYSGSVVANLIQNSLRKHLLEYQLSMHVEAMFAKEQFWSIVNRHEGRIRNVKFELISPNMSNISNSLELDLAQINRDTNSHRTTLELNSPDGATLEITDDNTMLNSLVEYSSEGGGDISVKAKNVKKRIHTSNSIKTIHIDEISAENLNRGQLDAFVRNLMED